MRYKIVVGLIILVSLSFSGIAQNPEIANASFCGKMSGEYEGRITYSVGELRNCNLVIVPEDTALRVSSFHLTIVPMSSPGKVNEYTIDSDHIPSDYLEQLCSAKAFRLEKIMLVDRLNNVRNIKPIVITVLP